jgi:hypothetical protein
MPRCTYSAQYTRLYARRPNRRMPQQFVRRQFARGHILESRIVLKSRLNGARELIQSAYTRRHILKVALELRLMSDRQWLRTTYCRF